jgi:hypothetical protein
MERSTVWMHKYIWGWVLLFSAIVGSFSIAMHRVSQTEKFAGQAVVSWTCEGKTPSEKTVTKFVDCAKLTTTNQASK